MIISLEEQLTRDFDWFAVDEEECIAHFTSAGFKNLPCTVCESAEDLQRVTDYFYNQAPVRGSHMVDSESFKIFINTRGDMSQNSRYLKGFVAMADKGLYSYDIETYVTPGIAYFRVAIPQSPISLNNLPEDIRKVVQRTKLHGISFVESSRIDYESTLII